MYFSSINNRELRYFHKIIPHNFNLSLTDVLMSDLFYIETIIPNTLYRIYLLFYCEEITSSNSNDVILENKCIICNKTDEETYFNFTSDDNDKFILNRLTGHYTFGDVLTDEDYNAIVQLLRANNSFTENIQINDSTVKGKYGTFVFNLKSTTIVDNGILITNETLSSIGTIKLVNPTFKNSSYKLKLTVYSLSDVNVCNEASSDNINETELVIDLIKDSEVNIPFNTLDLNCIVGFNAVVDITHDLPVIQYPRNIVLASDKSSCIVGDTVTLTATYLEVDTPMEDEILTFKNNNDVLGTAITNSNGIAIFTYNPRIGENMNITVSNAENKVISNIINIAVAKKQTTISLNVNKNILDINEVLIIGGTLKNNNELLTHCNVKIMNGNQELYSLRTDEHGNYYKEITVQNTFNYNLKAIYDGNEVYSDCDSNYANVKIREPTHIFIEMWTSPPVFAVETSFYIKGYLLDGNSNGIPNKTITCKYKSDRNSFNLTTDENGMFTDTRILNSYETQLLMEFSGDDDYSSAKTTHYTGVVKHTPEFRDVTIKSNTITGYLVQSENNRPITNATVNVIFDNNIQHGCTTDSNGYFVNSQRNAGQNYSPRIWNSLNYDGDAYNYSLQSDLTGIAVLRTSKIVNIGSSYGEDSLFHYKGKLVDDLNNPIPNANLTITSEYFSTDVRTKITDENGEFTFTSGREDSFECVYAGDNGIEGCTGRVS